MSLRFGNVYGPRQDAGLEGGVVATFLERMAGGEQTVIFGDGRQSRDFVYVTDVVEALLAVVGEKGGPFNVGTGKDLTVSELHEACATVLGSTAEPLCTRRRGRATFSARSWTCRESNASRAGALRSPWTRDCTAPGPGCGRRVRADRSDNDHPFVASVRPGAALDWAG